MVSGDIEHDIKIPHKGDVVDRVKGAAFEVLDGLTRVVDEVEEMKSVQLHSGEALVFAQAALQLRYGVDEHGNTNAPIRADHPPRAEPRRATAGGRRRSS